MEFEPEKTKSDLSETLKQRMNEEYEKEKFLKTNPGTQLKIELDDSVPEWRDDNIKTEPDWESDYVSEYPSEVNSHYGKKDAGYYLSAAYRFGYLLIVLSLVIVGIAKGSLADEVAALAFILASRMWDM